MTQVVSSGAKVKSETLLKFFPFECLECSLLVDFSIIERQYIHIIYRNIYIYIYSYRLYMLLFSFKRRCFRLFLDFTNSVCWLFFHLISPPKNASSPNVFWWIFPSCQVGFSLVAHEETDGVGEAYSLKKTWFAALFCGY